MYKEIIEIEKLTCSEKEFEDYVNSLDLSKFETQLNSIEPTIHTFDEKYNWVEIENPANWKYYYTLEVERRVFLQNIVPYVWWLKPINDDNLQETINTHRSELVSQYVNSEKVKLAINYFKNK